MQAKNFQYHTVNEADRGRTVEEYLRQVLHYSGRKIQKLTRARGIFVNRRPAFLQRKLKENDALKILALRDIDYGVTPEAGSIDVLYEDEYMLILNKAPFMLVHPAGRTTGGTLANRLAYYFQQKHQLCTMRPVHRLDRDTSGCVAFAKDAESQSRLEAQLREGDLARIYSAFVSGNPQPESGTIDLPIAKDVKSPNRRTVHQAGEPAVTHYATVAAFGENTLLRLSLETGRTHQIRVHLAHIGHPVVGDRMYGARSPLIARQALHAEQLTFRHLQSNETITVTAPLPKDMEALLHR